MNYYIDAWKNIINFRDRASRKSYWMFALIHFVVAFVMGLIDGFTGTVSKETGVGMLGGLYTLASLLPIISLTTRRLHDTDRSGWWQLLYVIPILGALVVLIFTILPGNDGDNRFGEDPYA